MLVVTRFTAAEAAPGQPDFPDRARAAIDALAARPGFVRGRLGRATDDPSAWVVVTEWANVGSYRRALSAYDVRITAGPVLGLAHEEPSGFEVLYDSQTGAAESDRGPG